MTSVRKTCFKVVLWLISFLFFFNTFFWFAKLPQLWHKYGQIRALHFSFFKTPWWMKTTLVRWNASEWSRRSCKCCPLVCLFKKPFCKISCLLASDAAFQRGFRFVAWAGLFYKTKTSSIWCLLAFDKESMWISCLFFLWDFRRPDFYFLSKLSWKQFLLGWERGKKLCLTRRPCPVTCVYSDVNNMIILLFSGVHSESLGPVTRQNYSWLILNCVCQPCVSNISFCWNKKYQY